MVAGEDFSAMMTHAKRQMEEARTKILNGEAGALPYKRGQESGCDYCPYGMSVDSMLRSLDMNTVISERWEKKRLWRRCG